MKSDKELLTQKELKALLDYNESTGVFTWKVYRSRGARAGDNAGTLCAQGYINIKLNGYVYRAHRLAWLYVYGVFPNREIDHRDRIRDHNWIKNLRDVTPGKNKENCWEPRSHNKCGFLGVIARRGKWRAHISVDGKQRWLGTFDTPALAHEEYLKAKKALHLPI